MALLDTFVDGGSLIEMCPDACGLHDSAEIGSFQFIEVMVESIEGLLLCVDFVSDCKLNLAQNLVHIIHVDEDVACAQIQAILDSYNLDVVLLIRQSFQLPVRP